MKRLFRMSAAVLGLFAASSEMAAQTDGTVALKAVIHDYTGDNTAEHWTVAWVTTSTGTFVKTLWMQGGDPITDNHWNSHCSTWWATKQNTANGGNNVVDGYTSATATSYTGTIASPAANNPIDPVWDCRNASGNLVADGDYRFYIQYAEDAGQGPVTTALQWTKGPAVFSQTYANQGTTGSPAGGNNFTNMSVVWTPSTAPEIVVEQPPGTNIADGGSKAFGSVAVGSSTDLTFTIKNTGTADLTGLAITKNGTHAADFTVTANPSAPVAAGGSTTFTVRFAPGAGGARTAAIHIASNDADEAAFDITLTGTGTVPEIAVEQPAGSNIANNGSRDFGAVAVGSDTSLTFTVNNTGVADLTGLTTSIDGANATDFTVTATPSVPVSGGGSTTFTVRFAPGAPGARSAALHLGSNDGDENPFDINLTGTGNAPTLVVERVADVPLAPGAVIDFGSTVTGGTVPVVFTVKNTGNAPLTGVAVTIDGAHAADYPLSLPPATSVPAGGSTTFTVDFTPSASGGRLANLHLASNDPSTNPFDLALTGSGYIAGSAPAIAVEYPAGSPLPPGASIGFGDRLVRSQLEFLFTLRNTGGSELTRIIPQFSGPQAADFAVTTSPPSSLAAGATATFGVTFTPAATGARNAMLHLASNDPAHNPFDLALSGNGTAPVIAVEQTPANPLSPGATVACGSSVTGVPVAVTLTIRNTGTALLANLAASLDGPHAANFAVTTAPPPSLAAGASADMVVTFTPSQTGARNAVLHLASSDPVTNPFDLNLSGTGTAPPAPEIAVEQTPGGDLPNGATCSFGTVNTGASTTLSFTIRNNGNAGLTGLTASLDGLNAADFTLTSAPAATVAAGGSTTLAVRFAPAASGSRAATLHLASNDADENPFDIQLTGTGFGAAIAVEQTPGGALAQGATVNFGSTVVGTASPLTFTIRNTGTMDLTGIAITSNGSHANDFTLVSTPAATLAAGASSSFTVSFAPAAAGARVAILHIASNDAARNPFDINLNGTGTSPTSAEIAVDHPSGSNFADGATKDFGSVSLGANATAVFTIKNVGSLWLTGLTVTKDGANPGDFTVTASPIAPVSGPGGTTTLTVRFAPLAAGTRSAALHIANNDADESPFDILLTGTGVATGPAPDIAVEQPARSPLPSGATATFPTIKPPKKATLTFTVRNTAVPGAPGAADLLVSSVLLSGPNSSDFFLTANLKAPIKPGKSKTFKVKFAPRSEGTKQALVTITSNDPDENPYLIQLTGRADDDDDDDDRSRDVRIAHTATTGESNTITAAGLPLDFAQRIADASDHDAIATAAQVSADDDFDCDGLSNLLEFAFGADPLTNDAATARPRLEWTGSGPALSFRRLNNPAGLRYTVEQSSDLRDWLPVPLTENLVGSPVEEGTGAERVAVHASAPQGPRCFLRVKVQVAP